MTARRLRVVSLLAVTCLFGCAPNGSSGSPPPGPGRVAASGTGLMLDGKPWWPAGLNAYQLATDWSLNKGCGAQPDLEAYFAGLPPNSLTRFDAFDAFAIDKQTGALDFRAIDAVFRAADDHHQLVLPVLTSWDGACSDEQFKTRDWYVDGWRTRTDKELMSYRDWVKAAVGRWKDSPALAMWELIGEPQPTTGPQGECPPDSASVLRKFTDDVGGIVRSADGTHPITVGTIGADQCGTARDDFRTLATSPYLDVLQYHDYGADGVPLPGDEYNGLAARIGLARQVGKPLLVAEIGEYAGAGCTPVQRRASDIATKIHGQRKAGTAGAMLWSYVPDPRETECTFDIGPNDPVRTVLAQSNTIN